MAEGNPHQTRGTDVTSGGEPIQLLGGASRHNEIKEYAEN